MPAEGAAVQLRTNLTETIDRQRQAVRSKLAGRAGVIFAPLRWLLTIGALIWFPFVQPVLDTLLSRNEMNWSIIHETHELVVLTVRVFSVSQLLQDMEFLAMYYFVLWVILRWHTQRQINRFVTRWKNNGSDLSLTVVTIRWLDEMLDPVRKAKERASELLERRKKLPVARQPHLAPGEHTGG